MVLVRIFGACIKSTGVRPPVGSDGVSFRERVAVWGLELVSVAKIGALDRVSRLERYPEALTLVRSSHGQA
jgi:hypothetical protein